MPPRRAETHEQWQRRYNAELARVKKLYGSKRQGPIMAAMAVWQNKPENKEPDNHSFSTYRPPLPTYSASGAYHPGGHQHHHFGK